MNLFILKTIFLARNSTQKVDLAKLYILPKTKRVNKDLFDEIDLKKLYIELLVYVDQRWRERFILNDNQKETF